MTQEQKKEITKISKEFYSGFTGININGSGWLIVDPLSAFLNACGYENELKQLPESKEHPLVLIMIFKDGSQFIPAGGDLKSVEKSAKNWMWL
jgi:hypothetical protein